MIRRLLISLAVILLPLPVQAQEEEPFRWSETMRSGSWLRLRNLNGEIRVEAASGDRAEVVATKRWRRGDPSEVRIEVVRDGGNVTICALYSENAYCDAEEYRHERRGDRDRGRRHNDVHVEFTVRLPRGVNVLASSVNGEVKVSGATAAVHARTVNGAVDAVSSGGPVEASTVNGSIDVRMGALSGSESLEYSTVNGSITVEVPPTLHANLEMSTVNGRLSTDFPMTVQGRINPKKLSAQIGKGGRRIKLSTVNGSIELRKAGG